MCGTSLPRYSWLLLLLVGALAIGASAGEIHKAAREGNVEKLGSMLEDGADVDATNRWGSTPLHLAARSGSTKAVKLLLEKGADPEIENAWGRKPRTEAARNGHWGMVSRLMPEIKGVPADLAGVAYVDQLLQQEPDHPRRVMLVFPLVKAGSASGQIGAGRGLIANQAMWRSTYSPGRVLDTWDENLWEKYADQQLFGKGRKVTEDKIEEVCAVCGTENYITGTLKTSHGEYKATIKIHGENGTREKVFMGKEKELNQLPCRIARAAVDYFDIELSPPQKRVMEKPPVNSTELLRKAGERIAGYAYFNTSDVSEFWEKLAEKSPTPWTEYMYLTERLQRRGKPSAKLVENWGEEVPTTRSPALDFVHANSVFRAADQRAMKKHINRSFEDAGLKFAPMLETSPHRGMVLRKLARCLAFVGERELCRRLITFMEEKAYEGSYPAKYMHGDFLVS
ncbi:MAG: ankyrin repeat domain-containing protein, partial [Planctomycetota bacterium]